MQRNTLSARAQATRTLALVCLAALAAGPLAAQISFIGVATNGNAESGGSLGVSVPAGAAGDLLLAVTGVEVNPSTSTPSGWTPVPEFTGFNDATCASGDGVGIRCQLAAFYRIADGSETTVSWNYGPNVHSAAGAVLRYRGVDTTAPIGVTASDRGSGVTLTAPSVTLPGAGSWVVRIAAADATQSRALLGSAPATSRFSRGSAGNLHSVTEAVVIAGSDAPQPAAGATGTVSWSSGTSEQWAAGTIELRAAAPSPTIVNLAIPAAVAGNVADCYPALKSNPPICRGDGRGDNHNDQLPAVPKFISAALNGSGSSGNGSKGISRIQMEWKIGRLADTRIRRAWVVLTTHRGTVDRLPTYFYWISQDGDAALQDHDYQSPGHAIRGAVMPVPPVEEMAVGDSGRYRFDVTRELRRAVGMGYKVFTVQGRVSTRTQDAIRPHPLLRGLEVYSTCSCSQPEEWPQLRVSVER